MISLPELLKAAEAATPGKWTHAGNATVDWSLEHAYLAGAKKMQELCVEIAEALIMPDVKSSNPYTVGAMITARTIKSAIKSLTEERAE